MPSTKEVDPVVETKKEEQEIQSKAELEKPTDPSSSGKEEEQDPVKEAANLLAQGKRHLFVKDFPNAVTCLGDACGKLSQIHGELSDECADAFYNYGCALLELAREESGVIEVENKEKGSDEEAEAAGEEDEDDSKVQDETLNESKIEEDGDVKESEVKEEGSGEPEEEEDVNNLQLAWEMFELSKVIFTRMNNEGKLSETYLKLGEVALESENYEGALADMKKCLELQSKILPPVSRQIAETLFQLGIACSLCNQFDEAIKYFTNSGVLLEKRIQNLSKMDEPDAENQGNPFYTIEKEIEELRALLPEIKDKIADMEEFKSETMKAVVQATINNGKESSDGAGPSTANGSSSASASTKPASDISHLIRKKRKNEDETAGNEAKKPNVEDSSAKL